MIKPDVTLYEEPLDMETFQQAAQAIHQADLLIIGELPWWSIRSQSHPVFCWRYLVVINKTSIPQDKQADLVIEGKIGEVFAQLRQSE